MLSSCQPHSSDATWHGTCLALAEFAQRGLLLPAHVPDAVPLVHRALTFDLRRGGHSVGVHVRDAAAYVCWACARAYEARELEGVVGTLAPALMVTACFDREVNCRRCGISILSSRCIFPLKAKYDSASQQPHFCSNDLCVDVYLC